MIKQDLHIVNDLISKHKFLARLLKFYEFKVVFTHSISTQQMQSIATASIHRFLHFKLCHMALCKLKFSLIMLFGSAFLK